LQRNGSGRGSSVAQPGSGCFPLCEECWQALGTPAVREPYYMALVDWWEAEGGRDYSGRRELIRLAVRNEAANDGEVVPLCK